MALIERLFPVMRNDWNFFDHVFQHMQQEMQQMEEQMENMRRQMFHLIPQEQSDVIKNEMSPKFPVVEEKGETKLKLEFNVQQFKPEEVQVKILGHNILQVLAKHEEKSDSGQSCRMYMRQYTLPDGVDADKVKPTLTKDGVLTIEAPAPALKPKERMIPIDFKPALQQK